MATSNNPHVAIDPGSKQSGLVVVVANPDVVGGMELIESGVYENSKLRTFLRSFVKEMGSKKCGRLVIETPKPIGQPVSGETMETMIHIGRFIQTWSMLGGRYSYVFRQDVKLHLCGLSAAKDPHVRQALMDRFGGEQKGIKCQKCKGKGWFGAGRPVCTVCGGKKWEREPGPLHKVASHAWAALGVACWWVDTMKVQQTIVNPNQKKSTKSRTASKLSKTVGKLLETT